MVDNPQRPSVFELVACESLKNGLREALRYLLDNINQLDNVRRLPLPKSDETILILDLLIEYNYLRSYGSSYAENLYNLVRVTSKKDRPPLLWSLACLAVIPYVKRKLDRYIEDLNYKETRTNDDLRNIRLYRIVTKSTSFFNLICLARYATDKSCYHKFLDGLLDISLISRVPDLEDETDTPMTLGYKTSKTIADLLGRCLTLGSYVIQFLDYWNTHSNSAPLLNASLPIPEPPTKTDLEYTDERSSNICLICLHVRQNECALSNTGYVFCYSCIQKFVTTKQRCPVTGIPTTNDNIVKLFTASTPF